MEILGQFFSVPEIIGFVFGVVGVYLTIKENIWCFPVGLINVAVSLVLFFQQKLYSDAIQQFVYIILLSYGWYQWLHGNNHDKLTITSSSFRLRSLIVLFCILFSVSVGAVFSRYTDASLPYLDATATALSFAAQWMIAKKKIENWSIWIVVNILYIGIYTYKGLFLYVALFAIYLVLAFLGRKQWREQIKTENLRKSLAAS